MDGVRVEQRKRERRRRRAGRSTSRRAVALLVIGLVAAGLTAFVAVRALMIRSAYLATRSDLAAVRTSMPAPLTGVTGNQLAQIAVRSARLHSDLQRMDSAVTLPFAGVVTDLPWVGPRYANARRLVIVGELLSAAGVEGGQAGSAVLGALSTTGVNAAKNPPGPTWLDVLSNQQASLARFSEDIGRAKALREQVVTTYLPRSMQAQLHLLDSFMGRVDPTRITENLPALSAALGNDRDVRYAVIFQDPQHLRPTGGFAGTLALVTVSHGRLKDISFSLSTPLTDAYNAQRTTKVPMPWPIQSFFPQDGFQIQDALWWPDYPRSAEMYMHMYRETGWPAIDGVIAVQPAVVSDLLRVFGPITTDVDGEARTVTADNLLTEIERPERMRDQGIQTKDTHKDVLISIGEELIQRMTTSGAAGAAKAIPALMAAADRRDIQLYSANPAVEQALDKQAWSGRIAPEPQTPTLAVTFANVAINKASLEMHPSIALALGNVIDGRQQVTLTMDLHHTGSTAEDPLFAGFQKWYVEVVLPESSALLGSTPQPLANPEAPNGGSYQIDLFPQQIGHLSIQFSMPATSTLLIRRQPGLNPVQLSLTTPCRHQPAEPVTKDVQLNVGC